MYCTQLAGNAGCKKSPSRQHRTTLPGYIFATKARAGTAIYELPVKVLTSSFDSLIPMSYIGHDISAIRGRFLLIFAFDKLNVRHISTSALVDLLI